jgi:hypothetical protein
MAPGGIIAHHTATRPGSDAALDRVLINGRPDLPGPLCHLHLTRQGQYRIIAAGVAHHAGSGGWQGLSGNRSVIGIEAANDGRGEAWPSVQLSAYDRGAAALLTRLGKDESWLCGHLEWAPGRKIDPLGIDLGAMRARISAIMEPMTTTQARIEVATEWRKVAGEWMTPLPTETRQQRLTRLAAETLTPGGRTAAQIATHAVRISPVPIEPSVPAWVLDPTIPA